VFQNNVCGEGLYGWFFLAQRGIVFLHFGFAPLAKRGWFAKRDLFLGSEKKGIGGGGGGGGLLDVDVGRGAKCGWRYFGLKKFAHMRGPSFPTDDKKKLLRAALWLGVKWQVRGPKVFPPGWVFDVVLVRGSRGGSAGLVIQPPLAPPFCPWWFFANFRGLGGGGGGHL